MRQDIIFGSDSDEKKVLPGIERATAEIEGLEVRVHYASADNTPEKVAEIMESLTRDEGPRVLISGAGMSNVLTGVAKTYADVGDLVIGVPIDDSKTEGRSSWLSTAEKPPGNPVLTVGLNNTYAALNIAYRFLQGDRPGMDRVVWLTEPKKPCHYDKMKEELEKIGIAYTEIRAEEINAGDAVVNHFASSSTDRLAPLDGVATSQGAVVITVDERIQDYMPKLGFMMNTEAMGFVGNYAYRNAAYLAAQLVQDKGALDKIKEAKDAKAKKLGENPGLLVINGKTEEYRGG